VNMPTYISINLTVEPRKLTVVWSECLAEHNAEELRGHTTVIQANLTLFFAHLYLQRLQQHLLFLAPYLVQRVCQWFLSTDVKNQIVLKGDLQTMLNRKQVRLSENSFKRSLHLVDTLSMIVLSHHAGQVDCAEVGHHVFDRKEVRVLEDMKGVGSVLPVQKLCRVFCGIDALVKERHEKHAGTEVESMAPMVYDCQSCGCAVGMQWVWFSYKAGREASQLCPQ
jgi:hypothetical protein